VVIWLIVATPTPSAANPFKGVLGSGYPCRTSACGYFLRPYTGWLTLVALGAPTVLSSMTVHNHPVRSLFLATPPARRAYHPDIWSSGAGNPGLSPRTTKYPEHNSPTGGRHPTRPPADSVRPSTINSALSRILAPACTTTDSGRCEKTCRGPPRRFAPPLRGRGIRIASASRHP